MNFAEKELDTDRLLLRPELRSEAGQFFLQRGRARLSGAGHEARSSSALTNNDRELPELTAEPPRCLLGKVERENALFRRP